MIINVGSYIDRWQNNYIVYHKGHVKEKYGDIDRGFVYFDEKYQQQIEKMADDAKQSQIDAIVFNMKGQGQKAKLGLQIMQDLRSGNLIDEIMDKIADGINQGIDRYYDQVGFDNYETIIQSAKKFNKALSKGHMSAKKVNEFFELLFKGIEQAGKYDIRIFQGLTGISPGLLDIGKSLSGDSNFSFSGNVQQLYQKEKARGSVRALTQEDLDMTKKILAMLTKAVEILQTEGKVSSQSFSSTINNIFSTVIGERISRTLLAKGLAIITNTADNTIMNSMKTISQGKLTYRPTSRYTLGGSRHSVNPETGQERSSKVDILNSRAFNLTVTENGQDYDIEIGVNTSVKWYKKANAASSIHMVAGTPLGSYFKSGTEERYLAYNILAHSFSGGEGSDFHLAYRALRSSTAATFFNEWMTGTGFGIKTAGGNISRTFNNKVQYLMINGRVYSVMRIIRNICNELAERNSWDEGDSMPFKIKVEGLGSNINKWEGTKPNVEDAMIRSAAVNEVISKFKIAASLNGNILTKYAY